MKKLSLFLSALSISLCSFSQVSFQIISSTCDSSILGSYNITYADSISSWGSPDMNDPANAVQGCLVLINDGTPGNTNGANGTPPLYVPNYMLGCDTSTYQLQDLSGKIAVIYRGTCEFGYKAYNAQQRGAIGVIIINHTGEAVQMLGGNNGMNVTIPVIQIGRADGDSIVACIDTVCNGVVGFIGNRIGYYGDNMATDKGDVLMPENLATPQHLAPNGTVFPLDLGLSVYNIGTNTQTGVTATVTVVQQSNGSTVYNQTAAPIDFNAWNSNFVDTQYIDLGTYAPSFWDIGIYTITYTINAAADDYLLDNSFSYEFKITDPLFGYYAKSRTDNSGKPIHTTAYSLNQMDNYDTWETCITYKTPTSYNYNSMQWFKGLTFVAVPTGYGIVNEMVEIKAYEWNDVFTDIYTPPTFNNLVLLTSKPHTFLDNNPIVELNFDDAISIMPNQRYLFCVNVSILGNDSIRLGYDEGINYKSTVNNYLQPVFPLMIYNSAGPSTDWFLHGFGIEMVPSIVLNFDHEVGVNESQAFIDNFPYPNPTTNLLTIPIRKGATGNVLVEVFDLTRKLVLSENKTNGNEPLKVNVASIKNGTYLFNLTFANGTKEVFKISVNR